MILLLESIAFQPRKIIWPSVLLWCYLCLSLSLALASPPQSPKNLRLVASNNNRPPIAADDAYSTGKGQELSVPAPGVLANDSDPDGDSLTAVLVSEAANGTLAFNSDGSFSYTPKQGFTGQDAFRYRTNDGKLVSSPATVTILVNSLEDGLVAHWKLDETSGTMASDSTQYGNPLALGPASSPFVWRSGYKGGALHFDGLNDRAEAINVALNRTSGGKNTIAFWMYWQGLGAERIVDMGSFFLMITSNRLGFRTVTSPYGDFLGNDSFTPARYGNRWVHIAAVLANADTSVPKWQEVWEAESRLYINGVEQMLTQSGYPPAARSVSTVRLGCGIGGGGTFIDHFKGALDDLRIYARELTATEVNALYYPLASDDRYSRKGSQSLTVEAPGVLLNDTPLDRRALTALLSTEPKHGTVLLNTDGSLIYTPNANWYWGDSFRYRATDGFNDSNDAVVSIVTDAPVAVGIDTYNTHTNTSVTYGVSGGVLHNDTDLTEEFIRNKTLTAVLESDVSHGQLALNHDGSFTYTPHQDFTGADSFTYRASDGVYYSNLAVITISVNATPKPVPELSLWQSRMLTYGATHGGRYLDGTYGVSSTEYEPQRVFTNIADYTGDSNWRLMAQAAGELYRDGYVLPNKGAVAPYYLYSQGLTEDYLRNQDIASKNAVILMSQNAPGASDAWQPGYGQNYAGSREVAYILTSYVSGERLGESRRPRLAELFNAALGHLDQWTETRGSPYDDIYWSPFMMGLTAEALIYYWDHIDQDRRILAKLQPIADAIWEVAWQEAHQAFTYRMGQSPLGSAAPDLSLLIAPLFSWLYLQTGDATYRDRGDLVFAGGVKGASLGNAKQFCQSYRWSFDYLKWRKEAEEKFAVRQDE